MFEVFCGVFCFQELEEMARVRLLPLRIRQRIAQRSVHSCLGKFWGIFLRDFMIPSERIKYPSIVAVFSRVQ